MAEEEQYFHIRSAPAGSPQCAFLFARWDSLRSHANTGLYVGISARDAKGGLLLKCAGPLTKFTVDADRLHFILPRSSGAHEPAYVLMSSVCGGPKQDKEACSVLYQDLNRGMKFEHDWSMSIAPATFSAPKTYIFNDFAVIHNAAIASAPGAHSE